MMTSPPGGSPLPATSGTHRMLATSGRAWERCVGKSGVPDLLNAARCMVNETNMIRAVGHPFRTNIGPGRGG